MISHPAEAGGYEKETGEMNSGEQASLGRLWKVGTRRGMAYAEGRELAERILSASGQACVSSESVEPVTGGKRKTANSPADSLLPGTMAVYLDRRGKPFAWQIAFDVRYWDTVSAMVNGETA